MPVRGIVCVAVLAIAVAGCGDASPGTSSSPTTATTGPPPTTEPATTTTAIACAPDDAVAMFATATDAARLATIEAPWVVGRQGSVYADAVVVPEAFADALGFACAIDAVQAVGSDHERFGIAAWTGDRMGFVVLAIDQPTEPYDEAVRFDLLFEQPYGEWVADDVWAVTVSDGDSVIVGVRDYLIGAVAKSFLVAFPQPTSPPPELPAEQHGTTVLEAAGMSNVGIAEPSDTDVASLAFVTPLGNVMVATIGPVGSFDAFTGYLTGDTSTTDVDGVDVRMTLAGPGEFGVADVAFECGAFGWRIEAAIGAPTEAFDVARAVIAADGCG